MKPAATALSVMSSRRSARAWLLRSIDRAASSTSAFGRSRAGASVAIEAIDLVVGRTGVVLSHAGATDSAYQRRA